MKIAWLLACALALTGTSAGAVPVSSSVASLSSQAVRSSDAGSQPDPSAITPLGFYWQVTLPQRVLPGKVLLAAHRDAARKEKRSSRSDQQFFQISSTGSNDVPEAALRAYRRAADAMASCGISWTFLAAIGRVETNHGRYGGAQLSSDGVSRPEIRGPQLDGAGPFAAIHDTDDGRLDRDKVWDRAVGQMQFLPATWRSVARDADGDGRANPDDLDDAAMSAAVYLCGAGDLSDTAGMARAAFRYNPSDYYVSLVLAFEKGYQTGVFAMPSPPPPPGADRPGRHHETRRPQPQKADRPGKSSPAPSVTRPRPSTGAATGSPSTSSTPSPAPKPSPTPTKGPEPVVRQVTLTGQLGTSGADFTVDGRTLDLDGTRGDPAKFDFDGDGTVESNGEELQGLAGRTISVLAEVTGDGGPARVLKIEGHDYR